MVKGTIGGPGGVKGLGGNLPGQVHYGIQGPPGGHYIPEVKQTDGKTAVITFTASNPDMPAVVPAQIELPVGPPGEKGADGKADFVVRDTPPDDTSVLWVDPTDNSDDGFQEAVNEALAQAKASGEFKGDPGEKGEPGEDYVLTDADKEEIAGMVEAPEGSGGGIAVTGAKVGQTVKIAEVDENGVPTAWESVDFPSGGGGDEWKLLHTMTLAEDTKFFEQELGDSYNAVRIAFENLWCVEGISGGIAAAVNEGNTASLMSSVAMGSFINNASYPSRGLVDFEVAGGLAKCCVLGVNKAGNNAGNGFSVQPKGDMSNGITKVMFSLNSYGTRTMNTGAVFNIYGR